MNTALAILLVVIGYMLMGSVTVVVGSFLSHLTGGGFFHKIEPSNYGSPPSRWGGPHGELPAGLIFGVWPAAIIAAIGTFIVLGVFKATEAAADALNGAAGKYRQALKGGK